MTMTRQRWRADVAIVGAGFAGSLAALALRHMGRSVVLLERGRHPRFAIGESSTPLASLLLEQLCDRYRLDSVRPLAKWGTWQRAHPAIACGLKRGFSFFHHEPGQPFIDDRGHARQLLVAASPHDEIADTHWYRPAFDAYLAGEARRAGATYVDEVSLQTVHQRKAGVVLEGRRHAHAVEVRARFMIDATGPRGFLSRTLRLADAPLRWLPPTQALYAHFTDVGTWETVLPPADEQPPYPVDAAALHHVFPGGWIWVLRFNNGVTSAGAALTDALAGEIGAADGAVAWTRLLDRHPSIREQFARARAVTPFVHSPRLAFRSGEMVGPRWAMLPSAAAVIDPLLSTGFPLALLGLHRLLDLLERWWERPELLGGLEEYARATERETDATEQLVAALYASMPDFELFKRLTLLYFAAAGFSEAVRRLGHPDRARGFLLCDDDAFGPEMRTCAALALERPTGPERAALRARIDRAIAPFDVAGLGDRSRRDWYPVRADDLMNAASRLGATPGQVAHLLERSGFESPAGRSYA